MVGGHAQQCGWLTDKFGVSWQIVPKTLTAMMQAGDTAAAQRAVAAMLQMVKLDIAALEQAYHSA
jgi:predicted 3-demethylubiquinone-9 3-methyltransferase (glyoxalase superfamily)